MARSLWNNVRLPFFLATIALFVLTGCARVFEKSGPDASSTEILQRASLVVVGVIEDEAFESDLWFRASAPGDPNDWGILRRTIRVESVLRGSEPRPQIDVYEVFWLGGATGDWNSTRKGDRAVFPLREEQGTYRLVQDWAPRSIYPVTSGFHNRLPLDNTKPLWERIALMNFWIPGNPKARMTYPYFSYNDPANVLSLWRVVKLERGLVRHPSAGIRVPACRELLLLLGWGQDECWEMLSLEDQKHLHDSGYLCCSAAEVSESRNKYAQSGASGRWHSHLDRESRRLLTAMNNRQLRTEFCRLYNAEYPGDTDTGCPADQPPPATIVTERGDVPLQGDWPHGP